MKVAFLSFDFGQYCIRLVNSLAQEAEVMLLLPDHLAAPHLSQLNPAVKYQPFKHPRLRQPLRQLRTVQTLLRHIDKFDPDVIHFQHTHLWFNLAWPLLARYPVVITIHDPRHHLGDRESQKTPQAIMELGYRRADRVIVHGEQLRHVVVDELGIPADIVHVIPPVPDIVLPPGVRERSESRGSGVGSAGEPIPAGSEVLFFGRIWEYKGLEYLIRAEPLITAQVPEARIVIAGRGEDFTRYRRMMVNPDHFLVHNEFVPDSKLIELFQRASVVALPYIDASLSGVVAIAYTFGKPVVATSVGILPEMVDHGQTGYIVPPRDVNALADAIVRVLQDKELSSRLGANGKRKVETVYSPDAVARQTLDVYRCAINDSKLVPKKKGLRKYWEVSPPPNGLDQGQGALVHREIVEAGHRVKSRNDDA